MNAPPLLIEFVAGTRLYREAAFATGLPIVGNGPPGTFVIFPGGPGGPGGPGEPGRPGGHRVPLPTDQIIAMDDHSGTARVGFGGMRFVGLLGGQLVFHRVKDLWPAAQLSPERGRRMTLETTMVATICVDGVQVWPEPILLN